MNEKLTEIYLCFTDLKTFDTMRYYFSMFELMTAWDKKLADVITHVCEETE
jgi:hypothetical protein